MAVFGFYGFIQNRLILSEAIADSFPLFLRAVL